MLSKDAQSLTTAQLTRRPTAYFHALFNRTDVSNIVITPTFTSPSAGDFRIDVAGTGKVATSFTKVFGQQTMNINVTSEVLWGIKKLELALALDNTGSMVSSSKMTELKKAVHTLLDTMKKAAKTARRHQGRDHPVRHHSQSRHLLQGPAVVRHRQHRLQRLEIRQRLQQQQLEELLGRLRPRPHPAL